MAIDRMRNGDLGEVARDLWLAARRLRQRPGLTLPAIAILALAIGAGAAVFSLVEAVLLRPLPYRDPARLVMLWEDHSRRHGNPRLMVAPATFEDYRRQSRTLRPLAAILSHEFDLVGGGVPEVIYGSEVDAGFFPALGVAARLGRTLTAADLAPGAPPAAVLADAFWRRRFGGDRRVLGRALRLDDFTFTVVGVMPPELAVPLHWRSPSQAAELWVPLRRRERLQNHQFHTYYVIGRLAPGATLAAARAETRAIAARLALAYPKECGGVGVTLVPLAEQVIGEVSASLRLLLGAVVFLLLIACGNLAGLLAARSAAGRRELAVCAALGAGPGRLAGRVLAEALLLAAAGGAAGLALALGVLHALPALLPPDLPRAASVRPNGALLAFAIGSALATGLLAAAVPAWQAAGASLRQELAASGRGAAGERRPGGRPRLGDGLVVAQMALSLLLLAGAGLMLASFARLRGVDPGFRADHALTFEVAPNWPKARTDGQRLAFFQQMTRRLEALPGVVAVGAVTRLPLEPAYGVGELVVEGRPVPREGPPQIGVRAVTPGYFRAMAMPILAGRPPSESDMAGSPGVALVNRALAARYLGGAPAVGGRLSGGRDQPWMQVVGEVGDTAYDSLAGAPEPELFVPYTQGGVPEMMAFVVRGTVAPLALAPAVRRIVWAIDKDVPVHRLRPLADQVGRSLARPRFALFVVAAFAGLALALAAAGIGALMAFTVAQRTREIGIRMALGAERRDALRLVLGRAARLALAGAGLGLAAGGALMRWLAGQLFAARAAEPLPYLGGALCLLAAALAAAYLPARRASRVDPVVALRQE